MTTRNNTPLIQFGPRVRKSPFFAATRRYGFNAYTTYNHMYMPLYYEDPVTDYWRLINDVTLWDVACQRQVEITGADAERFVQLLTPRNLSKCKVSQCKYVLITNEHGGIINDPVLLRLGENHFWLSLADSDVLLWAQGVALNSGMDVNIAEPDVSPIQVQGPKSMLVMAALFGDWINELRYFWLKEIDLRGMPLVVSRTGWSGELGYEIYLRDGRYGDLLWEAVMEAGKPYNIGLGAPSQIRRMEAGLLSYGSDMTTNENPFEIGFEKYVDLEQQVDFIGKDSLRRIKAEGIKRRLVGLEIDGPPLKEGNEHPWTVFHDGRPTGKLSSCVYSPRLDKNISIAIVASKNSHEGTGLEVETTEGKRRATVVSFPFYDPEKNIPVS